MGQFFRNKEEFVIKRINYEQSTRKNEYFVDDTFVRSHTCDRQHEFLKYKRRYLQRK